MNTWIIAVTPSFALAACVLFCRLSGNDKAPFLLFGVVLLNVLILVLLTGSVVFSKRHISDAWWKCGVAAAPLVYVGLVIYMSRKGWVDSMWLLGFR